MAQQPRLFTITKKSILMDDIAKIMQQNLLIKEANNDGDEHLRKAAQLLGLPNSHFNDQIKKQAFAQILALLARIPWGTIAAALKTVPWKEVIAMLADEDTRNMVFNAPKSIKEAIKDIISSKGDTKQGVGNLANIAADYDKAVSKWQDSFTNLKNLADKNASEEELEKAKEEFIAADKEHIEALKEVEKATGEKTPGDIEADDKGADLNTDGGNIDFGGAI